MSRSYSPWSRRCPKGHASVRIRGKSGHYACVACQTYYEGSPTDIRNVEEYPLDESEYEVARHYGTHPEASDSPEVGQ